ncbi:MAG: hypothetical protein ACLVJ6_16530 [Merdibacter sp.]
MRELQEYKAEIFRRSEIRIARRKKRRRRAGILCIACMLCGTFAVFSEPRSDRKNGHPRF